MMMDSVVDEAGRQAGNNTQHAHYMAIFITTTRMLTNSFLFVFPPAL
jgi:hypothetical protein